jgi:hypothetical protein
MQRTKSLDSKLDYNRIDLQISQRNNFQRRETPRNAAESRIKTDSLLQALGMMAPSASKKNSKLTSHVKPNSLHNSAKSPQHTSSPKGLAGKQREKALVRNVLGSMTAGVSERKEATPKEEPSFIPPQLQHSFDPKSQQQ